MEGHHIDENITYLMQLHDDFAKISLHFLLISALLLPLIDLITK